MWWGLEKYTLDLPKSPYKDTRLGNLGRHWSKEAILFHKSPF